jgi:penicillin-binding protein 1B
MSRRHHRPLRIALATAMLIVLSLALIAFSGYLLRLDREIRERFAGARWALPAQVYAGPMELYTGLDLSATELVHELGRLGYREDPRLNGAGSYQPSRSRVDIHVRGFAFWDDAQPAQKLAVRFDGGSIGSIQRLDDGTEVDIVRLDPMLIGSIFPRHGEDRARWWPICAPAAWCRAAARSPSSSSRTSS